MSVSTEKIRMYDGSSWVEALSYTSTGDVSGSYAVSYSSASRYIDMSVYTGSNRATGMRGYKASYYAIMFEALAELPSGFIAGFSGTPPAGWIPVGWTLRFPYGSATPGGTGEGTHVHTATIPSGVTGSTAPAKFESSLDYGSGSYDQVTSVPTDHVHTISQQIVTSGSSENVPEYYDIVFCVKE